LVITDDNVALIEVENGASTALPAPRERTNCGEVWCRE